MRTALLIIDIQNDYFPGGKMELEGCVEAASAAARLLGAFRKESWPVMVSPYLRITFMLPTWQRSAWCSPR